MTYADVFAGYEAKTEQLREWVKRHYIGEFGLQPGKLLDAGCGNGFWAGLFSDADFTVRGFDNRPELIAQARLKHPDIPFSVADAEKPLRFIGKYDVVFARTLPQFYARNLDTATAMTANLLRHVKPGGLLLLSIYTDGTGQDRPMLVTGTARHHPVTTYLALAGTVGTVRKSARYGNYLQIAVVP